LNLVTRPTNLQLLRAIVRENPKSIRETVRFVDRGIRQVHRNLRELEELGMIDRLNHDPGKPTEPQVWYDTIAVDLPLDPSDEPTNAVSA
jgi:predicted transcriptional regulator